MRFTAARGAEEDRGRAALRAGIRSLRTWLAAAWEIWGERRFARRESLNALALYHRVKRDRPELTGRQLYVEIVARCMDARSDTAQGIVRRAEESFAAWPSGRKVCFRDVATYVIVDQCLTSNRRAGTPTHIDVAVARVIPAHL